MASFDHETIAYRDQYGTGACRFFLGKVRPAVLLPGYTTTEHWTRESSVNWRIESRQIIDKVLRVCVLLEFISLSDED